MARSDTSWFHKHSIAVYLILANGITWFCWIPSIVIGSKQEYLLPTIDSYSTLFQSGFANSQHLVISIVFSLGVYGPLIAALVGTWLDGGKEGLVDLWGRITKWRVGVRWYLIILLIAFLLPVIPVGLMVLTGVIELNNSSSITFTLFILLFLSQILTSGLGEEPGWRGFLLPRLQAQYEGQKYIWVLGLIWAIWHYPFTIYHTLSIMQDVTVVQMIVTILFSLAGQTITLIGMTFIYVWLYNNTKSVFIAILFHALGNVMAFMVLSFVENQQAVATLIAIMPWVIVFILNKALGKERFPGQIATG